MQKIDELMQNTACQHHGVGHGEPCWTLMPGSDSSRLLRAICGRRIKSRYNGQISDTSVARKKSIKGS